MQIKTTPWPNVLKISFSGFVAAIYLFR